MVSIFYIYSPLSLLQNACETWIFLPSFVLRRQRQTFFSSRSYYYDVVNDTTTIDLSGILSDIQKHIYIDVGFHPHANICAALKSQA